MPVQFKAKALAGRPVEQVMQDLLGIVAREAAHLDALWQLLTRQQQFLVEGNVAAVESNVREQELAIRISRELETERGRLLKEVSAHLEHDHGALTLSRLAELLSGSYAERLEELRATLISITRNIERTRRQNDMLINRSLYHIGETIRLLAGSAATAPAYSLNPTTRNTNAALVNRVG